jgi:hypothetical protein
MSYRCIHCLTPCDSLYRQYGISTIKLSQCSNCKRDVDPYCEREWFLVILDCILLREEAYRHVLFHRLVELEFVLGENNYIWTLQLSSSLLRAHLMGDADTTNHEEVFKYLWFFERVIESSVQLLLTVAIFYGLLFIRHSKHDEKKNKKKDSSTTNTTTSRELSPPSLATRVYLAMLLPTICQVATLLVQIWEPSDTVRQLGSLLVFLYQWMGITTLVRTTVNDDGKWSSPPIRVTLAFVVAVVVRATVGAVWKSITSTPMRCPGLEWTTEYYSPQSLCLA